MKKIYLLSGAILLFLLISLFPQKSFSYNFLGADLEYEYVKNDSVKLILNVFVYCGGTSTTSETLTIKPESGSAFTITANNTKNTDITQIPAGLCNRCTNASCSNPYGYQKRTFEATVDLSGYKDCEFTFSWVKCCRAYTSSDQYVEAKMNRCLVGYRNSPKFAFNPAILTAINTCTSLAYGATEGGNDSLVYELVPSKTSSYTYQTYTSPYTYEQPFTLISNSVQCGGFILNKNTGVLNFYPTKSENGIVCVKVSQYTRDSTGKAVKIGEIRRDCFLTILQSSGNDQAKISFQQDYNNYCDGEKITITATTTDQNTDSTFINGVFGKTGSTISVSSGKYKTATFQWVPGQKDARSAPYYVYFSANDRVLLYNYVQTTAQFKVGARPDVKIAFTDSGCGKYYFYLKGDSAKIKTLNWIINGEQVSSQKNFSYKILKNGQYNIKVISNAKGSNCTATFYDTLIHKAFPVDNFLDVHEASICKGNSIKINTLYANGTYKWQPSTGLSSDTADQPIAKPLITTTYSLKMTDENGCVHQDSIKIKVEDFEAIAGNDTTVCKNKVAMLRVKPVAGATYQWQPTTGVNDPTAAETFVTSTKTTTYIVSVKNALGCVKQDSLTVTVTSTNANAGENTTICLGDSALLQGSGGYKFRWYNGSGVIISEKPYAWVKPVKDEEFTLIAKDSLGCSSTSDKVYVKVNSINAGISESMVICPGDTVRLKASGGNKYTWKKENSLSKINIAEPLAWPQITTTYSVLIQDTLTGCSKGKEVKITVLTDCVLPGDANHDKQVNYKDHLYVGVGYDVSGNARNNQGSKWKPVQCDNWINSTGNGTNFKHLDAMGDGKIGSEDFDVVYLNYNKTVPFTSKPYTNNANDVVLKIQFAKDTFLAGDTVVAEVFLGDKLKPAENLYGCGFAFTQSQLTYFKAQPFTGFNSSVLDVSGAKNISRFNSNDFRYEAAIVRTDRSQSTKYGKLATIKIPLGDTTYFTDNTPVPYILKLTDALIIDNRGKESTAVLVSDTAWLLRKKQQTVGIAPQSILHNIHIYPNPASSQIIISGYSEAEIGDVTITNTLGQVVLQQKLQPNQTLKIDVKHFPAGLYMVSVKNDEKQTVKKLMISR